MNHDHNNVPNQIIVFASNFLEKIRKLCYSATVTHALGTQVNHARERFSFFRFPPMNLVLILSFLSIFIAIAFSWKYPPLSGRN
jgi:hypothetical protein